VKGLNKSEKNVLYNLITEDDWLQYLKTCWTSIDNKGIKLINSNKHIDPVTEMHYNSAEIKKCLS
jgi:hypothetical protein